MAELKGETAAVLGIGAIGVVAAIVLLRKKKPTGNGNGGSANLVASTQPGQPSIT